MKNKGFTTIEILVAVAVVSILTAMAMVTYKWSLLKAQSAEAGQMVQLQAVEISNALKKGQCTKDGNPLIIQGKYGKVTVSGKNSLSNSSSCPSGCTVQYKFNSTGVDSSLSGKVLAADVLNNLKLSKNDATTLPEKYWPHGFAKTSPLSGDNCAPLTPTDPTKTEGDATGNETGLTQPTDPSGNPDPSNPDPNNPSGTPDPATPSIEEQVKTVRTFKLSGSFYELQGANDAEFGISVPPDLMSDYYDLGNYKIITKTGNWFGVDYRNTTWRRGMYDLSWHASSLNYERYPIGQNCGDTGCATMYDSKITIDVYYKGVLAIEGLTIKNSFTHWSGG